MALFVLLLFELAEIIHWNLQVVKVALPFVIPSSVASPKASKLLPNAVQS
jgi:hypothetical protein